MSGELTCKDIEERGLVERFVAGKLMGHELESFQDHLLLCDRCQQGVWLGMATRQELIAEDRATRRPRNRLPRIAAGVGIAVAAAAAVLFVVSSERVVESVRAPEHRAPIGSPDLPTPVAPLGVVREVGELRWQGLAVANRYRVTIVDSAGLGVWDGETTDTFLVIPGSIGFVTGRPYFWKVEARVDWDRWEGSEFVEFRLSTPPTDRAP